MVDHVRVQLRLGCVRDPMLQCLDERAIGHPEIRVRTTQQDVVTDVERELGRPGGQGRLADTGFTGDEHHVRSVMGRLSPRTALARRSSCAVLPITQTDGRIPRRNGSGSWWDLHR